jgi:hypothetical protein
VTRHPAPGWNASAAWRWMGGCLRTCPRCSTAQDGSLCVPISHLHAGAVGQAYIITEMTDLTELTDQRTSCHQSVQVSSPGCCAAVGGRYAAALTRHVTATHWPTALMRDNIHVGIIWP